MTTSTPSTHAIDLIASERVAFQQRIVMLFGWTMLAVTTLALAAFADGSPLRERFMFSIGVVLSVITVVLAHRRHTAAALGLGITSVIVLLGWTTLLVPHSDLTPLYLVLPGAMAVIVIDDPRVRRATVALLFAAFLLMRGAHHLMHQPDFAYTWSVAFDSSAVFLIVIATTAAHRRRRERDFDLLKAALAANTELTSRAMRSAVAARQANDTKSAFLERISHELRTPLNAIIGYSEMLDEDELVDEDGIDDLHRIQASGQHLLALVDDLLDLNQLERGIASQRHPVVLGALLEQVADGIGALAAHHRNDVVVSSAPSTPVLLDEVRTRRALDSLAHNAVRFTEGGTVRLSAVIDGLTVVFRVADSGVGIDSDRLPRLFEPFVQGSSEIQYEKGGTGLGLALCDRAIRQLGGHIEVESQRGVGTCFTVVVPIAEDDTSSADHSSPASASRRDGAYSSSMPITC